MKTYKFLGPLALAAASAFAANSQASTVLTFEGVGNQASVNNFYNGGTDSAGHSGANYGVEFSSNSLGLIDADAAGGGGNFANEPTPNTILFFLSGGASTMNVAAGFDTGFSFYYTSAADAFVNVWSGLNSTGSILATLQLSSNYQNGSCSGDPYGDYCHWDAVGVAFSGIAHSVDFGGSANAVGFDNITLGSETPGTGAVPLPAAAWLFGSALLGLTGISRRKRASLAV